MKKTTLIIAIITILSMNFYSLFAQEYKWYIGIGVDMKMAIEGPYKDQPNDIGSTFNYELLGGLEFDHWRFGMALENHKEIGYRKWTYLQAEYIIRDFPLKNFSSYAGLETSVIYRLDDGNYYSDTTFANPGMNLEMQYAIPKSYVSVAAGFNWFRAEGSLIETGKKTRFDVMLKVYFKI